MNVRLSLLLLVLAGATARLEGAPPPGRLGFVNGDVLLGTLAEIDWQAGEASFLSPPADEPNRFRLEALRYAVPAPVDRPPIERAEGRVFYIELANGDALVGQLVELTEATLTIDTLAFGTVTLPREQVGRGRWMAGPRQLIFEGPREGQSWSNDGRRKRWTLEAEALFSNGDSVIGCDVRLPGTYRLSFDVSFHGSRSLNLHLGCRDGGGGGDDYYLLQFSEEGVNGRRYQRHHPRLQVELQPVLRPSREALAELKGDHQHFAIDVDGSGLLTIAVNEEPLASFRDPAEPFPAGDFVAFATPRGNRVRLRDLRVYAWDAARVDRAVKRLEKNGVVVGGGGPVKPFREGRADAWMAGEERFDLEDLTAFQLGADVSPRAQPAPNGIQVRTFAGSRLQVSSPRLVAGHLVGKHPWLGEIKSALADIEFLLFPAAEPVAEKTSSDRVAFRDGGSLTGSLMRWEAAAGMEWSCPHAKETLRFPAQSIRSIVQASNLAVSVPPPIEVEIYRPDNIVPGERFTLDGEQLTLTTPFSEPLAIPRKFLREIRFLRPEAYDYWGPGTDAGEWQAHGDGEWTFEGGVLRGRGIGGIGHAVALTERGRIDLRLEVTGVISASIGWFCRDLKAALSADSYQLRFEDDTIMLFRGLTPEAAAAANAAPTDDQEALRNLRLEEQLARFHARFGSYPARRLGAPAPSPFRSDLRERHLSICWDATRDLIALVAEGEVLHVWTDEEGLAKPSDGLVFYQHASNATMAIADLRVSIWNGVLPERLPTTTNADEFFIRLRNEDIVTGNVVSVSESELRLKSADLGELLVPLQRIEQIRFPQTDPDVAWTGDMAMRGIYRWGGECLFFLRSIDEGMLRLSSPFFGDQAFRLDAFKRLDFDLRDFAYWSTADGRWEEPLPPSLRQFAVPSRD